MGKGKGSGLREARKSSVRFIDARSRDGGNAPVPKDALRLRSSTEVLLPSQWSCMPRRGAWFQTDGKSQAPIHSLWGTLSIGKFSSALGGLKVSKRPGPKAGSRSTNAKR